MSATSESYYSTEIVQTPVRAVVQAEQAILCNTAEPTIHEYDDAHEKALKKIAGQGQAPYYVRQLRIYKNKNYINKKLQDPAPDVAAYYHFDENKTMAMGHFDLGKPVNNTHGYHAVMFQDKQTVSAFDYVDQNQKVRHVKMDNVPETLRNVAQYLKTLTAPTYQDVTARIAVTNPELAPRFVA